MLIGPGGFEQLAQGATLYSSLTMATWGGHGRIVEYGHWDGTGPGYGNFIRGYDANGSVVEKIVWDMGTTVGTEPADRADDTVFETTTYQYNLQNRLASVITTPYVDGVAQTPTTTEYRYDPDGNRVQKTVDSTVTDYLIDAYNHTGYAQVFKETTGSDSTVYIIGDDVIGQAKGADENAPKYLLYDGHGSTRQLVNNTDATVLKDYSYDAYGVMLGGNPGSVSNPDAPATNLLYAGEQFDIDAQQYYLRARYYDPLNGRFNRIDDFAGNTEDPQSLHKYLYCHANPVNAIDPSGEMTLVDLSTTTAITALISGIVFTATSIALDAAYGVSGMQMLRNALFAFGATVLAVMSAPFAIALISAVAISLGVKALSEGLSREDGVRVGTFLLVAILLSVIFKNCAFTSRLSPKGNPDVAGTFKNAVYREVTLKPGTLLKRAFERGKTNPIRSYTTRGKTANMIRTQQDAVDLLNLYPAQTKPTDIATLKVSRPVKAWVGKVEGGGSHAFQYWIEDDAALDLVGTEPLPIE